MHLSVNAIIWCVTCKMEGENTVLEAVRHSFAIMDSDPDGGIGEIGEIGDNIRAISDPQLIDGALYLCPSFQMRNYLVVHWFCIMNIIETKNAVLTAVVHDFELWIRRV